MKQHRSILFDARLVLEKPTGIGQYVASLLPEMARLAPDLHIHMLRGPAPWPNYELAQLSAPNVTHHVSVLRHMSLGQHLALPRLARRLNVSLLHYPHFDAPVLWRPMPVIATIYDAKYLLHPEYFPSFSRPKTYYMKASFQRTLRQADAVITLSQSSRDDLLSLFHTDPSNINVIYAAADSKFSPSDSRAIEELRIRYRLTRPFILSVGEIRPHKNFVRLIEAYSSTQSKESHDLVIIGQTYQHYSTPQATAVKLGVAARVHFFHDVNMDDLVTFYSAAELYVLVSLYEGFGLPILEAGACGTPIIASNTTATGEITGEGGLQVDPTDIDGIAGAMDSVLQDESFGRDLAMCSRQRAQAFSWRKAAQETIAIYRAILEKRDGKTRQK